MRLAYITNVNMPAGDAQSIQVQAMVKAFVMRLGSDFVLVSPKNKENKGVNVDYAWKRIFVPRFLPRAARYALLAFFSMFIAVRFRPDFIYTRDIGVAAWYRLLGFRAVYEVHKPFETKIGHWLFSRLVKSVKIVAISDSLKQYIQQTYRIEPERILVAHDGVFLEDFPVISHQEKESLKQKLYNCSSDEFVVTYAGSTQSGKGIDLLNKIVVLVGEKKPQIKFFVIGGQSRDGGNGSAQWLGRLPHKEIPRYLQAADAVIFTNTSALAYYKYTSPLKLFEYMASGTPIVASNIGSVSEVINDSNAYLFDPSDVSAGARAVCQAMDNRDQALSKAVEARHDAQGFTWPNRVSRIVSFLKYFNVLQ